MMAKDKGRLAPFVPLLKDTLNSPAWRATSFGARALYVALKRRVPKDKNCAYLSYRDALKELGRAGHRKIHEWFRELEHYGFITLKRHGSLGVEGKGQSPLWQLTEMGCTSKTSPTGVFEPPTCDFMKWDGVIFEPKTYSSCPYPSQKRKRGVVKTSLCKTGSAVQGSSLCKTGSALSSEGGATGSAVVVQRGVQGAVDVECGILFSPWLAS